MRELEGRIEATERRLLASAREIGALISGDGRVTEDVAAQLLGIHRDTLRKWRQSGEGPDHFRLGGVTYSLHDLASFIECCRVGAGESGQ
jgi:hypothetical protein